MFSYYSAKTKVENKTINHQKGKIYINLYECEHLLTITKQQEEIICKYIIIIINIKIQMENFQFYFNS